MYSFYTIFLFYVSILRVHHKSLIWWRIILFGIGVNYSITSCYHSPIIMGMTHVGYNLLWNSARIEAIINKATNLTNFWKSRHIILRPNFWTSPWYNESVLFYFFNPRSIFSVFLSLNISFPIHFQLLFESFITCVCVYMRINIFEIFFGTHHRSLTWLN